MLSKVSILSLALLAGASAQTTTTGFTTQTLPAGTLSTTGQVYTAAPTTTVGTQYTTLPATQYYTGATTLPSTQYVQTAQPQIQYVQQPQIQYVQAPATTAVQPAAIPSGPQYPQYKRWAGKACVLIDLTLSATPSVSGYQTLGVISENDLNGDLSCDVSDQKAAVIAAKIAGTYTDPTAAATTPAAGTDFAPNAANCATITAAAADVGKNTACIALGFVTKNGSDKIAAFTATAAKCGVLSPTTTNKISPNTEAKLIDLGYIAKCVAAKIATKA